MYILLLLLGCGGAPDSPPPAPAETPAPAASVEQSSSSIFAPLVAPEGLNPEVVSLGRALFHDPRLSSDDTVSCASCHDLARGGVDRLPRSVGVGGALGIINTPTVLNSGLFFSQFWDGRAATLESQIDGPTHNPLEMASSWPEILGKLEADPAMVARFKQLYPDSGLSAHAVRDAIATFERSLVTAGAPLDRHLQGEVGAMSDEALRGLELFTIYGCVACHQGATLGGNMYQVFGVMADYFADRGDLTEADLGRYNVTGVESDKHVFKVPSLRNVAETAPYFHDGSAATLEDAVRVMARYQLGRRIPDEDVADIVAFLESLTGAVPAEAK